MNPLKKQNGPTYRIGNLPAANTNVIYVTQGSSLREAITLMMHEDFSQLPVMNDSKRNVYGVVTWKSIAQKSLVMIEKSDVVKDFMETGVTIISNDTSLFQVLPLIISNDYVLIKNHINQISGIVTASDVSAEFQLLTEPFLLLSEIEQHLREILSRLDISFLKKAKDPVDKRIVNTVHDLSFGEYIRIFADQNYWSELGIALDKSTFTKMLQGINEIRNSVMHYRPNGLSSENTNSLRKFVNLLRGIRQPDSTQDNS